MQLDNVRGITAPKGRFRFIIIYITVIYMDEKPLWKPSEDRIKNANMTRYIEYLGTHYDKKFSTFADLWKWSVDDREKFWRSVWDFTGVIASRPCDEILVNGGDMLGSRWFTGARLNFAENLLKYRDDRIALLFQGEGQPVRTMTYRNLYDNVARLASAMRDHGIVKGDRIAGFVPNMIESAIAMLAAASIGAIWSSCSPDFGIKGVLDRFGQIEPRILFTADGYHYNGKTFGSLEKIGGILRELPSIEKVVVIPYAAEHPDVSLASFPETVLWADFISGGDRIQIKYEQLPFDHPLYIMYSSGTTGVPKCIVHGAGGTLLQHLKELVLHTDLGRDDRIFYYTTCGWMMWNWLVSSLAVGATLLLYDGSPFHPGPEALWTFAEDTKMTIFGTSAKYISALDKSGLRPRESFDLSALRAILSTGSPLSVESFHFVYDHIKEDICLSSISGGTDIISCFALGNPVGPVWPGELQTRGLGMDVDVFDIDGNSLRNEQGELVCRSSFPSGPIYFWNDPDSKKYRRAYFDVFPNIWCHGDFVELTDHDGMIIYGRSDATLNPGGVRIGTAEIYRQVEAMDEVVDSLAVGQKWDDDVRVVLFLKLAEGVEFDERLVNGIKKLIRANCTPRHVPAITLPVADIPYTISGKKVELAVRRMIEGLPVLNRDALKNPEALELYRDIPELRE